MNEKAVRAKKVKPLTQIEELIKAFTIEATRKGCPQDQIINFLKAGVFLQPKQLEFCALARQCDSSTGPKMVLSGGGRGPLALTTPILTIDGWKTMESIHPGDIIFDEKGNQCNVIGESEIYSGAQCYELEFDTGEKIIADSQHDWATISKSEQKAIERRNDEHRLKRRIEKGLKSKPCLAGKNVLPTPKGGSIKTTYEIFKSVKTQKGRETNHRIKCCDPLRLSEKSFPLDPYLLGLWLGDGDSACGGFTTADNLYFEFERRGFMVGKRPNQKYRYVIYGLWPVLVSIGLLNNKHIPEMYLFGSESQRIELIRGLMDTDGCCAKNGTVSFVNTNKKIIDGMVSILNSLGVKTGISTSIGKVYGKECSRYWKVHFSSKFNPFALKRKSERFTGGKRKTNFNHYINSVRECESVPVKCISVDSENNLFLAGKSLIPTHNSAKSHAILAQIFCDDCQRIPNLKVLTLRKVGRANKEQIQDFRKKLLAQLPHNYREQQSTITFENGSLVVLGNFKDEKDIDKYLGLEYDLIYIMESNQLTQTKKTNILSCLRTNKTNWRPRCYQDTNPGGVDHVANKTIFVSPFWTWDGAKYISTGKKETETRYIHSTVDDNRFVDSGYKEYLEKLVGWQREAWLHGSWEFMAGAFFSNFHADIHCYPNPVTTLNERAITRWFGGLDYGYSHPNAFLLCCEDESGNIFCVAEYTASNTLIEEHAANIKDLLSLHGLSPDDLEFIAAGKDCFRVDKDGSTVATEYAERGIMLTATHIDRVNAWSQVAEVFGDIQHQIKPRCFIHKNCGNLITQIQSAQSDPKKPNDVLKMNADAETGEGGDDCLEGFRNAIVMAYSSLLSSAAAVKMGDYESLSESKSFNEVIDVEEIMRIAEEQDLQKSN